MQTRPQRAQHASDDAFQPKRGPMIYVILAVIFAVLLWALLRVRRHSA